MKRRRNFFSVLGVSVLAAMALTAAFASSASATGNGLFLINLSTITSFPKAVTGHVAATGSLLSIGLDVHCTLATFSGNITAAAHGKGAATFTGCLVKDNPFCEVEGGKVTTEAILAESLLLGKIVRFKPLTGLKLALVHLKSVPAANECLVIAHPELESIEVGGSACAEVVNDTLKLILSSAHCAIHFGGNVAEIHGPATLVVSGVNKVTTHA